MRFPPGIAAAAGFAVTGLAVVGLAAGPAHATETFVFDPDHTLIRATWTHLGLSEQSLRFGDAQGELVFDPEEPANSSIEVTIDAASLETNSRSLEARLESADFFDVENHPTLSFESTALRRTGRNEAQVEGELTIKGITQPVTLDVVMNPDGPQPLAGVNDRDDSRYAAFEARTRVLRSDFELGAFAPLTSDEVDIYISAGLRAPQD